ncbi:MAG: CoA transferase [Chloroflexi bacterium]|nr:CoA transferase [Chloroflexota bacterium]
MERELDGSAGPLCGVRVLDFTWALAGPFATLQLADLGAEVVKVEHPGLTEQQRGFGPYYSGISTFFFAVNRAKKAIAIDLATADGKDLALNLAREADVVVNNFRPGTMERLGLSYASISSVNPRVIYAQISAFGQSGPYRDLPGVDAVAQALGGTMSLNGYAGGPPLRIGVSVGDTVASLYLAVAVLAALHERQSTGLGQAVDVALTDAQLALVDNEVVRFGATGEVPTRQGSRHALMAPYGPFATCDGHIVVANVKDWPLFCGLIGRDDLALDESFSSNPRRVAAVDALEAELSRTFSQRTTAEWLGVLQPANICAVSRVNTIGDLFTDPQFCSRNMIMDVPLPYGLPGSLPLPRSPMQLSRTPALAGRRMPGHGEHTDRVLISWLGMSQAGIDRLRAAGAVK